MNISLTPELEQIIQKKIENGSYHSPSEVIRVALLLLDEQEASNRLKIETLKKSIEIGTEQLKNGNYSEYNEETLSVLLNEIKKAGREKLNH